MLGIVIVIWDLGFISAVWCLCSWVTKMCTIYIIYNVNRNRDTGILRHLTVLLNSTVVQRMKSSCTKIFPGWFIEPIIDPLLFCSPSFPLRSKNVCHRIRSSLGQGPFLTNLCIHPASLLVPSMCRDKGFIKLDFSDITTASKTLNDFSDTGSICKWLSYYNNKSHSSLFVLNTSKFLGLHFGTKIKSKTLGLRLRLLFSKLL